MTPQEIFNALMEGRKVKLTQKRFKELLGQFRPYEKLPLNKFIVYSIEQDCVNLYCEEIDEVLYDFDFREICLF